MDGGENEVSYIKALTVNHFERSYFGGEELRSDTAHDVTALTLLVAIRKLARRTREGKSDCMFVQGSDGEGWRLMREGGKGSPLVLRHYFDMGHDCWDEEREVTTAEAKRILKEEYWGC